MCVITVGLIENLMYLAIMVPYFTRSFEKGLLSMQKRWLIASTLIIAGLILAACGTVAEEPRPTFEPPPTFDLSIRNVNAGADGEQVAAQPTDTPVPPTDTPEPTDVPSTDVPPTDTPEPTEVIPTDTLEPTTAPPTNTPEAAEPVDPASVGDPANGAQLFVNNGCGGCHNVDNDAVLVGPSLLNIKDRAGSRVEGQTAVEYLHNSIVNPNDYIVEGFAAGVMVQTFGDTLSEQQINDLIAYLLTLE
jgi:cytochrome c2